MRGNGGCLSFEPGAANRCLSAVCAGEFHSGLAGTMTVLIAESSFIRLIFQSGTFHRIRYLTAVKGGFVVF